MQTLVLFKIAVTYIFDFLLIPASNGRYSTDHQEMPPKENHRDGWNAHDHHQKVQRGDKRRRQERDLITANRQRFRRRRVALSDL